MVGRKAKKTADADGQDMNVPKRLKYLEVEKKRNEKLIDDMEKKLAKKGTHSNNGDIRKSILYYKENIGMIEREKDVLAAQMTILQCDDKPVRVQLYGQVSLEEKLANAYCALCASTDLKMIKTIQIECRKCGRKRMITMRLDKSKR